MTYKERFPGLCRATLELAYDNGGINRDRSEDDCLHEFALYLEEHWLRAEHAGLRTMLLCAVIVIDDWLSQLSDEDVNTACNGEETEAAAILETAPHGTSDILDGIFEHCA